ncbi:DUF6624 domain-containing protein [Streptomyces kanamyceticus]|uniref:Uncharacterized protein n=1 Tax=Streptomyces kanamyceticus TaxID=1967 RepID=A0A5J6GHP1_STRKN|nr:DUF6624 domain-containing protein [Streptomyces kanamyceticus]QEU93368.1 hypothetical protein CP970_22805 [Streptomyces kanamyceticus]
MTCEPRRPDIARSLLGRAETARELRGKLLRGLLSESETSMARHTDHANAQVLRRVVADHGWPGRSLVGDEAAKAAWQIALHADHLPDFQRLVLRLMATAVERGEVPIQRWAHLYDRCSVNDGGTQLYGTQYRLGADGVVEVLPVRDRQRLDSRRASVRLGPASAALDSLRHRHAREREADEPHDGAAALVGSAA